MFLINKLAYTPCIFFTCFFLAIYRNMATEKVCCIFLFNFHMFKKKNSGGDNIILKGLVFLCPYVTLSTRCPKNYTCVCKKPFLGGRLMCALYF